MWINEWFVKEGTLNLSTNLLHKARLYYVHLFCPFSFNCSAVLRHPKEPERRQRRAADDKVRFDGLPI